MLIIMLIGFLPFVLSIIALVSIVQSQLDGTQKLVWVIISLFVPIIGPILYFAIGLNQAKEAAKELYTGQRAGPKSFAVVELNASLVAS